MRSKVDPKHDWAHRMDHYQKLNSHYFKVLHSQIWITFAIILVLSLATGQILIWTLSRDYSAIAAIEKAQNDFMSKRAANKRSSLDKSYDGVDMDECEDPENRDNDTSKPDPEWEKNQSILWRKLKGEVMRAPAYSNMFAVFVGTGSQIYVIWSLLLTYQWANILSQLETRPYIWYFLVTSLACTGGINGYTMAKTMRMFGQSTNWKEMSCVSASMFPLMSVVLIFFIDLLEYVEQAEEEIDISTSLMAFGLWLAVCIPTTFLGASYGMVNAGGAESIQKPNSIPRPIPANQPCYLNTVFAMFISGATIFASFFAVFHFIWRSIWRSEVHLMLLYMWFFSLLTSIVISELSIIFTFLRLRAGDY